MTTQLKAGTSNAPEVIVFDFDTSRISNNGVDLGSITNETVNGLCATVDCYNCTNTQCNQVKCHNVNCNQVHCNQVKCNTQQCNQVQCGTVNCNNQSNCDCDCKD